MKLPIRIALFLARSPDKKLSALERQQQDLMAQQAKLREQKVKTQQQIDGLIAAKGK